MSQTQPAETAFFHPRVIELFEERIGSRPVDPENVETVQLGGTQFFEEVRQAVGIFVNHLAHYPHQEEGFSIEARYILHQRHVADRIGLILLTKTVPRGAEKVPENLCGLLELMLRAAESGARLGPVHFGFTRLPESFWRTLRLAVKQGLNSHTLLVVWAINSDQPMTEANRDE